MSSRAQAVESQVDMSEGNTPQAPPSLPPWPLFKMGNAIVNALPVLETKLIPPPLRVLQVASGFAFTKAIYCATKAEIAELLAAGPKTAAQLSAATNLKEEGLYRILRALESFDIFKQKSPGVWVNTSTSELLRKGVPGSMYHTVLHMGFESYAGHIHMYEALDKDCKDLSFEIFSGGEPIWSWLNRSENATVQQNFNSCMVEYSSAQMPGILTDFDWKRFENGTINDVGGGTGGILVHLMQAYPKMKGILFDRESVIEEAKDIWNAKFPNLVSRTELVGGDFFKSVPVADALVLKHILHDWSDEDSIKILETLRKTAIKPDGKTTLLLIELVLPDTRRLERPQGYIDLQMMAMVGGKERSESEWADVLSKGGFALKKVHLLRSPTCIIEAVPV